MKDGLSLALAVAAGMATGLAFFGSLWLTVSRGLRSPLAPVWFGGGFLVRSAIAVLGIYWVGGGDPLRLAACGIGFVFARALAVRYVRVPERESVEP